MTSVPPDYRKLADQCERLAKQSSQGEYHTLLKKVAAGCRELANQLVLLQHAADQKGRSRKSRVRIFGSEGPLPTRQAKE